MNPQPPFQPSHVPMLNDALDHVRRGREIFAKQAQCGADCTQGLQMADYLEQALNGFKEHFFTAPKPPSQKGE